MLPSGASVVVSGSAISPNPSNPSSVLVSYGGSIHVVFSVSVTGGAAGPSGPSGPSAGGIDIDIGFASGGAGGVTGGAGSPYGPSGVSGGAAQGPSGGFMFNGTFIAPSGSYLIVLPSGASVVVSGSAISPNPSNPSSVLVSYGGSIHVVFSVSAAGGAAGPSGPSGPSAGGVDIDISYNTGGAGGAGRVTGGAGSLYGPSGVSGGAAQGPSGGFMFNGTFIAPSGSYLIVLPSGASVVVSGSAISPNPSNPSSVLVSYGGSIHVVFSVSAAGGAAGPSGPSGPSAGGIDIDISYNTGGAGGAGGVTGGAGSPYGPSGVSGGVPSVCSGPNGGHIGGTFASPYGPGSGSVPGGFGVAGVPGFAPNMYTLSPGSPVSVFGSPGSSVPTDSDGSSSSDDEADSPNKLPYPGSNYAPTLLSRQQLPRDVRHFPLYVMFNPDGSVKPIYAPLKSDRRPMVVLPKTMMNRPPRPAVPQFTVGNVQISSNKFYQITINGKISTVPGRHIRTRKSKGGFSVKLNGQRRALRQHYKIVEVNAGVSGSSGGAVIGGAFNGASATYAGASYGAARGGSFAQNMGSQGGCGSGRIY